MRLTNRRWTGRMGDSVWSCMGVRWLPIYARDICGQCGFCISPEQMAIDRWVYRKTYPHTSVFVFVCVQYTLNRVHTGICCIRMKGFHDLPHSSLFEAATVGQYLHFECVHKSGTLWTGLWHAAGHTNYHGHSNYLVKGMCVIKRLPHRSAFDNMLLIVCSLSLGLSICQLPIASFGWFSDRSTQTDRAVHGTQKHAGPGKDQAFWLQPLLHANNWTTDWLGREQPRVQLIPALFGQFTGKNMLVKITASAAATTTTTAAATRAHKAALWARQFLMEICVCFHYVFVRVNWSDRFSAMSLGRKCKLNELF